MGQGFDSIPYGHQPTYTQPNNWCDCPGVPDSLPIVVRLQRSGIVIMNARTLALLALSIGACAKSPDSIAPAYVSEVGYLNWQCHQLGEEQLRLNDALARASTQQENARTNDTVGVILIGLPVSSLSGDNIAPEIARLKGEMEATRKASMNKGCVTASLPPTNARPSQQ